MTKKFWHNGRSIVIISTSKFNEGHKNWDKLSFKKYWLTCSEILIVSSMCYWSYSRMLTWVSAGVRACYLDNWTIWSREMIVWGKYFFISVKRMKLGMILISKLEGAQSQQGQDNILLHRLTISCFTG